MDLHDVAVVRAVAPVEARLVRAIAVAFGVAPVGILVTAWVTGERLPVPAPVLATAAVLCVLLTAFVLRIDLERVLRSTSGRAAVEAGLLVLAISSALLHVTYGQFVLATLIGLVVMFLAGLMGRRWVYGGCLGLLFLGEVIGVVRATEPEFTTTVSAVLLGVIGAIVASVLRRAIRELVRSQVAAVGAAERRADGVAAVADAAQHIHVLDTEAMLSAVADATLALRWDVCGVYVPLPGTDEYVIAGGSGTGVDRFQRPRPGGVLAEVVDSGRNVVRRNYREHPGHNARFADISTVVGAPITADGETIGGIVVGRRSSEFDEADVRLLELLAAQAGRAMETLRSFDFQRRAMEEVERSSRLKDDFVATVSHEVRTPLHVVLGMAETLDARWELLDDADRRGLAGRLRQNASDLHGLVEVLLDFSRLESGTLTVDVSSVDLARVSRAVATRVKEIHPDHDIEVVAGDELVPATADPVLIERVAENLVLNACRHTPPGTRVSVELDAASGAVRWQVRDDGPGIPPEAMARLGQRFYRGEQGHMQQVTRGVGLGLAFCIEILRLHGTELEIASELGQGATFGFTLSSPLVGASEQDRASGAAKR